MPRSRRRQCWLRGRAVTAVLPYVEAELREIGTPDTRGAAGQRPCAGLTHHWCMSHISWSGSSQSMQAARPQQQLVAPDTIHSGHPMDPAVPLLMHPMANQNPSPYTQTWGRGRHRAWRGGCGRYARPPAACGTVREQSRGTVSSGSRLLSPVWELRRLALGQDYQGELQRSGSLLVCPPHALTSSGRPVNPLVR